MRAELARQPVAGRSLMGGEVSAGAEMRFSIHPELNRIFFGEAMGVEARARYLRTIDAGEESAKVLLGLGYTSYITVGRMRVVAPFSLLVPEVAYSLQRPDRGLALRWSAPIAFLLTTQVSVEIAPSLTLIDPLPRHEANWLLGIGLGLGVRQLRSVSDRDPGYAADDFSIEIVQCRELDQSNAPTTLPGESLDLARARPYRRYLAVTRVDEAAPHFALFYEPSARPIVVAARRDAHGNLTLDANPEPHNPSPPVASPIRSEGIRSLAALVRAQFGRDCGVPADRLEYLGTYRDAFVDEFVLLGPANRPAGRRNGWRRRHRLALDSELAHVLFREEYDHGAGLLEIPNDAHFLPDSGAPSGKLSTTAAFPRELDGSVLLAANAFAAGIPPKQISSLLPADAPTIPPELVTHLRITLRLSQNLERAPSSVDVESATTLTLRDAVFATESTGVSEATLEGERYRVEVKLAPDQIRIPTPGYRAEPYSGRMSLSVADGHGRSFRTTLPVRGMVEVEGNHVVAAAGLEIPAFVVSSGANPRLGALTEQGALPRVHVAVSSDIRAEEFE